MPSFVADPGRYDTDQQGESDDYLYNQRQENFLPELNGRELCSTVPKAVVRVYRSAANT